MRSRESFANLSQWLTDARALASPHLCTVLVGNKSDREEDREVEWEEASRWAAENSEYLSLSLSLRSEAQTAEKQTYTSSKHRHSQAITSKHPSC
jgi:GTPase SAR1 family protein